MKAAVFSDTHRNIRLMLEAIHRCRPDIIIHLGDHDSDAEEVSLEFP
ncbi:MAG: metallophosphoesterase family protein, partial [Oscillospiraceae bacterium]|nr:metallophosphoesterase family protein [Oscillospiraceae bacterium]